jgi:CRP-like cAMP-binding protein
VESKQKGTFDAQAFLDSAGVARKIVEYRRSETIFAQGDPCDSVLYIQKGGVKLSVLSKTGREAVVAMLGPGDFFGEGCLAGQPTRMGSATAITGSTILVVDKDHMVRLLHKQHPLPERFITHMLARNIRIEEDLVDQLFNSSESGSPARFCCSHGTESRTSRRRPSRRSRRRRWRKWSAPRDRG